MDCGYTGILPLPLGSDLMRSCVSAEKELCVISVGTGYICLHQKFKLMDVRSFYCCNSTV